MSLFRLGEVFLEEERLLGSCNVFRRDPEGSVPEVWFTFAHGWPTCHGMAAGLRILT